MKVINFIKKKTNWRKYLIVNFEQNNPIHKKKFEIKMEIIN